MSEWRYEIQRGPDGQEDFSWVYAGDRMVCVCRTSDAIEIVAALSRPDAASIMQEAREVLEWLVRGVEDWCDAIENVGTGWDDWDEHYKGFAYRGGLDHARALLTKMGSKYTHTP